MGKDFDGLSRFGFEIRRSMFLSRYFLHVRDAPSSKSLVVALVFFPKCVLSILFSYSFTMSTRMYSTPLTIRLLLLLWYFLF